MVADLNGRSLRVVDNLLTRAQELRVAVHPVEGGDVGSTAASPSEEDFSPVSSLLAFVWRIWHNLISFPEKFGDVRFPIFRS